MVHQEASVEKRIEKLTTNEKKKQLETYLLRRLYQIGIKKNAVWVLMSLIASFWFSLNSNIPDGMYLLPW